jgi:hypothetical protein
MAKPKIFVVTKKSCSEVCSDRVLQCVVPQLRNSVVILEEESFDRGNIRLTAKPISDAIDDNDADESSYLLILDETRTDHAKLQNRWKESGKNQDLCYVVSQVRLIKLLDKAFETLAFDWSTYANEQLKKFNGKTTPLETWMRQFSDLKVGYIGRRLCMQLQVIGFNDNNEPFSPRAHEAFGQKVFHCYFADDDIGGSWVSIKDQLAHDFPAELVHAVKVTPDAIALPVGDADEIAIYEDGLWSGSEAVKRLILIKASGHTLPVRFKYAVVTDFGLKVARHAIRHLELQNVVSVDAAHSKLEYFLQQGDPSALEFGAGMELKEYFEKLHNHVVPGAFRNPSDWPEGFDQARSAVKDIGSQLVRHQCGTEMSREDVEAKVKKFALGGGGFGSTMMFKRSVPKSCLPLFWLAGPVSLNGVSIDWEPLFRDARRVDPDLLRVK